MLNRHEVAANEGDVVVVLLLEHADNTTVVNSLRQYGKQVVQQQRMLLKVERKRTVVDLDVGNLGQDGLELIVIPCIGSVLHGGQSGIVHLIVLGVQVDELRPEVALLCNLDELRQVGSRPVQLQVLHQTLRACTWQAQHRLGEYTHVGTLKTQSLLQQLSDSSKNPSASYAFIKLGSSSACGMMANRQSATA